MVKFYDTLLWEYLKKPWWKWLSLDDLAIKYFDYKKISYNDLHISKNQDFSDLDLSIASKYSGEDVYITNLLYQNQKKESIINDKLLLDIEIPLIEILCDMEIVWVKVDENKLRQVWEELKKELKRLEKQIYIQAWEQFNISSPKQVWYILFDKLGIKKWKKTKTWYSVDLEVLESLSFDYEIAKNILLYRKYFKLLSTYVNGLIWLINKKTNRIHTSYNQTVTTTGRLSSTSPNLQNIPSSSDWFASIIRTCFVPFEKDDLIASFDYSQIELRILAIMSNDFNLLQAFKEWVDIHKNTWSFLFWKDNITSDERKIAKSVNFWIIYWISSFWLSKMIWISQKEAKTYIEKFYEKYPKVWVFFDDIIKSAEKNWYVETMFKRKRFLPNILDKNQVIKKQAEREAINMPIQWTAADIIKIAMIKVSQFLKQNNLKSQMIMQVHDELVFNVKKDEFELLKKEISDIMENIIDAPIKLKVDVWYWKNWWDCK